MGGAHAGSQLSVLLYLHYLSSKYDMILEYCKCVESNQKVPFENQGKFGTGSKKLG